MATIIGRTSVADIKLSAAGGGTTTSYKANFSLLTVRCTTPQSDVSTFADEPNTALDPGPTLFTVTMVGLLLKGAGAVGMLMPCRQKVAATFQMDTSVSIAGDATGTGPGGGWFNFAEVTAIRAANQHATISGVCQSVGSIAVSEVVA